MKFKRELMILTAFACVLASCAALYAEQQGSLSAYSINYNSNTEQLEASGNVVLKRGRSVVSGDTGIGWVASRVFEISGDVRGVFPEYDMRLEGAESLKWTDTGSGGRVEARGGVRLARGTSDYIRANYVAWVPDTDNYFARGGVNIRWDGHLLRAAEVRRVGNTFYGVNVKRYENIAQKTGMAADRVDGKIRGNDIREVVAVGNVAIDYIDADGARTDITGAKAVYDKSLDTIVISGGARAVRSDGNTVSSETMILYIGISKIEAVGNATLSFKAEERKNDKNRKNGASN